MLITTITHKFDVVGRLYSISIISDNKISFEFLHSGTDTQAWNLGICSGKDGFLFHLPANNAANITVIESLINSLYCKQKNKKLVITHQ